MPYPELMVAPMREDLTRLGVQELRTPQDVDSFLANATGPTLLVINSVCGCAAGNARPAVALALRAESKPAQIATVFAGQDTDATQALRKKFPELPLSLHVLPLHRCRAIPDAVSSRRRPRKA